MVELEPDWTQGARTHPLLPHPSLPCQLFFFSSLPIPQAHLPTGQWPAGAWGLAARWGAGLLEKSGCQISNRFLLLQVWLIFYVLCVSAPPMGAGEAANGEPRTPSPWAPLSQAPGGRGSGPYLSSHASSKVAHLFHGAFSEDQVSAGNGRTIGEGPSGRAGRGASNGFRMGKRVGKPEGL